MAGLLAAAAARPTSWTVVFTHRSQKASHTRRRGRLGASPPRAALPDDLASALHAGVAISLVLGFSFSVLPILTGDSKERNERRFLQPSADEGADNLKWGVMSALSLVPFLNPMGWVFGALDDEDSSALYYSFGLLYALPYLVSGLQLDAFALAALAAGAAHMQVERLAQTEPVELELPEVARAALRSLPGVAAAVGRYGARVGGEVAERVARAGEAAARRPERRELEERSSEARAELESFDRRQRQRQRQRELERQARGRGRRDQGQGGGGSGR